MGVYASVSFQDYLAQGNAWLFIPGAILLGALHGLEPGHSKTMMAAFIVAIRGTVRQAVLLGLSATISHTAIIWILALIGLQYAGRFSVEQTEPYFQLATGVLVIGMAVWMFVRTRHEQRALVPSHGHHTHDHEPRSPHGGPLLATPANEQVEITQGHHHHAHDMVGDEFEDAHQRQHAVEFQNRFPNRQVTTGQLILFGLSGGLLPCPSAFAVLLICFQLKRFTLGFAVVLAFSLGLAITLVTVGSVAAFSVKHATRRFKGFGAFARKMPYVSSSFLIVIGAVVALQGLASLLR